VPKLWTATVEQHRQEVREAVLDSAWQLATERGLLAVSMSQIAERAGIGRATLYKYYSDVTAILEDWHQRQVQSHLDQLVALRDAISDPGDRLKALLRAYARICHHRGRHAADIGAALHRGAQLDRAERKVHDLLHDALAEVGEDGGVRCDVPPAELASYCLHALAAATVLQSEAAVDRLVEITLAGLRPPP
jgi:AcrR family transcriptional regulator